MGQSASTENTVTEEDVQAFGKATGDMNPVHFDEEYAKKTLFKGRVAHGVLSIGFISAVLGMKLPGEGTIFVSAKVEFKAPVRIGDTVVTTGTVKEIGERRRVVMDCLCTVNGNPVVIGEALVLAPKRPISA
ncbi:MAG TPA: MaoC family dehydratase [Rhizomicrobium sp.]